MSVNVGTQIYGKLGSSRFELWNKPLKDIAGSKIGSVVLSNSWADVQMKRLSEVRENFYGATINYNRKKYGYEIAVEFYNLNSTDYINICQVIEWLKMCDENQDYKILICPQYDSLLGWQIQNWYWCVPSEHIRWDNINKIINTGQKFSIKLVHKWPVMWIEPKVIDGDLAIVATPLNNGIVSVTT